jgi:hypothetical protein
VEKSNKAQKDRDAARIAADEEREENDKELTKVQAAREAAHDEANGKTGSTVGKQQQQQRLNILVSPKNKSKLRK